jgi:hypothetical protein
MKLSEFEALSFDCYGTLIDWEAGLSAVLVPWARQRGLDVTGERLLGEFAEVEHEVEQERPGDLYPGVLALAMRRIGARLGAEVTDEDAARLAGSVPDWPAFADSRGALAALGRRRQSRRTGRSGPWPRSPPRSSRTRKLPTRTDANPDVGLGVRAVRPVLIRCSGTGRTWSGRRCPRPREGLARPGPSPGGSRE